MIAYSECDAALGSRLLGLSALKGGIPRYKYIANCFFWLVQIIFLGYTLRDRCGYRAFSRKLLESLRLEENSNDFDNQMLAQIIYFGLRIGEISCPTRYFAEAPSINFRRSVKYGFGVLASSLIFRLEKLPFGSFRIFRQEGHRLIQDHYELVKG